MKIDNMQKLIDIDPKTVLWRGTVIKIKRWFKCPTGFYDYDMMLIDPSSPTNNGVIKMDVICINYKAGARNILSPIICDVTGSQAITAEKLLNNVLDMLNAIRSQKEEFTMNEISNHVFLYNINDIEFINPPIDPFKKGETYNN